MSKRILSVLATGVTGALLLVSSAWFVVGLALTASGELSWLSFMSVGLVCLLALRASLTISERALRRALANDGRLRN